MKVSLPPSQAQGGMSFESSEQASSDLTKPSLFPPNRFDVGLSYCARWHFNFLMAV
jgi:hypothetical protein